jgi:hypothetical protein
MVSFGEKKVTYSLPESVDDLCFLDKNRIIAITSASKELIEYNLETQSYTSICTLEEIAKKLSLLNGYDICIKKFTYPQYLPNGTVLLLYNTNKRDEPNLLVLYEPQKKEVEILGETFSRYYQATRESILYLDASTQCVARVDSSDVSKRTYLKDVAGRFGVSDDGQWAISDAMEVIDIKNGKIIGSLDERMRRFKYLEASRFTFSHDNQYVAFSYFVDEIGAQLVGHGGVYDMKTKKVYLFTTQNNVSDYLRVQWLS